MRKESLREVTVSVSHRPRNWDQLDCDSGSNLKSSAISEFSAITTFCFAGMYVWIAVSVPMSLQSARAKLSAAKKGREHYAPEKNVHILDTAS